MKKILLIWDFDGPIGQINATKPYRLKMTSILEEIEQVEWVLDYFKKYDVKCCFAITGFSAEKQGWYPYNFPDLVKKIYESGHEIASHSWKHEWIPTLSTFQLSNTLERSKLALENATEIIGSVKGFVPPHNKPSSWIRRSAFSLEDRYLYPFYRYGDLSNVLKLVAQKEYKWMRISLNPIYNRFGLSKNLLAGRVYTYKRLMLLENQHVGFGDDIQHYIEQTNLPTYTISAHPFMLTKSDDRHESKANLIRFIERFAGREDVKFVTPASLL